MIYHKWSYKYLDLIKYKSEKIEKPENTIIENKIIINEVIDKYPNGEIKSIGRYRGKTAEGQFKFYYDNGQIEEDTFYVNGKRHGVTRFYYSDGKLKEIENYNHGKLYGEQICYARDGRIIRHFEVMSDGEKVYYVGDEQTNVLQPN